MSENNDNYVLEITGVNKTFGGLKALSDINLKVKEGTTHAIIGPNGAGKSTLLNTCIAKLVPDSGSIMFAGKDLTDGMTPHGINQLGVSRVFQTPEIFPELALLSNVMLPALAKRDGSFKFNMFKLIRNEKQLKDEAMQNFRGNQVAMVFQEPRRTRILVTAVDQIGGG